MRDFENKRFGTCGPDHPLPAESMPGKRTLTEMLPLASEPVQQQSTICKPVQLASIAPGRTIEALFGSVQRKADKGELDAAEVHASAQRGMATPITSLPYAEQIQRLFGRHDISGIKAHTGSDATASAREMGAKAYATGDHVVLAESADLHTAAHEVAHVVQQRGGVQLKGGVGQEGDEYERHANAVADAVVQGRSAEALLDQQTGSSHLGEADHVAVQRVISFDGGKNHEREIPKNIEEQAVKGSAVFNVISGWHTETHSNTEHTDWHDVLKNATAIASLEQHERGGGLESSGVDDSPHRKGASLMRGREESAVPMPGNVGGSSDANNNNHPDNCGSSDVSDSNHVNNAGPSYETDIDSCYARVTPEPIFGAKATFNADDSKAAINMEPGGARHWLSGGGMLAYVMMNSQNLGHWVTFYVPGLADAMRGAGATHTAECQEKGEKFRQYQFAAGVKLLHEYALDGSLIRDDLVHFRQWHVMSEALKGRAGMLIAGFPLGGGAGELTVKIKINESMADLRLKTQGQITSRDIKLADDILAYQQVYSSLNK